MQANGLYPISQYFDRWAQRIERVTAEVPQERLLILKTPELKKSAERIADFWGVDRLLLSANEAHRFPAETKVGVLDAIDKNYLDDVIRQRCGAILYKYFA